MHSLVGATVVLVLIVAVVAVVVTTVEQECRPCYLVKWIKEKKMTTGGIK